MVLRIFVSVSLHRNEKVEVPDSRHIIGLRQDHLVAGTDARSDTPTYPRAAIQMRP